MVISDGRRARSSAGAAMVVLVAIATVYAESPQDAKNPAGGRSLAQALDQQLRWEDIDYSAINGANYVPTYAYNDVATWNKFDPQVVDRELGYAERAGINSVRVFLQIIVYEKDPQLFLERFETFLQLCDKHHITMMPVLFDSCFGGEPNFEDRGWRACPGNTRVSQDSWAGCEKYIDDVVGRSIGDRRVLLWDVMNEPMVAGTFTHTEEGRATVWRFVRHFQQYVNDLDSTHATCVGVASTQCFEAVGDLMRVLSFHSYFGGEPNHRKDIAIAKQWVAEHGNRPIIISEMAHWALDQQLEMTIRVCREEGIGYYFWELMIGQDPFPQVQGMFYPDGTIRYPREFCAAAGIDTKPFMEGVFVRRGMSVEEMQSLFAEALATPTRSWNLKRRMELLHSGTVAEEIGRRLLAQQHPGEKSTPQEINTSRAEATEGSRQQLAEIRKTYKTGDHDTVYAMVDALLLETGNTLGIGEDSP